ncbi:MAG TPA: uroporphyrinogen-III synthase, partial [Puia sp.]
RELGTQRLTAIFTSMNAVEAVTAHLNGSPSWTIFCIGGATRRLAESQFGPASIAGTAPSASELATVVLLHRPSEVFFFCGDQRREELPEKLSATGVKVHEVVVYRTAQTPQSIKEAYDGIVFFSPSAVHSFFSANTLPEKTTLFAIGHTTADTIHTYVNNPVITSTAPEKETLVRQTIEYYQRLEGARHKESH